MNMTAKPSVFSEVAYLVLLTIGMVYILVINYIVEPVSWREWFVQQIPPALAVLNLIVLIALAFSLTLYIHRLPLPIRYLALAAVICLGSFMKVSVDVAPLIGLPILLVSIFVYSILQWKRRRNRMPQHRD